MSTPRRLRRAIIAIVLDGDKFLVGKRAAWKLHAANYWCPVSGRMEGEETEEDTVVREVREEAGIDCEIIGHLGDHPSRVGDSMMFHCWAAHGDSKLPLVLNEENQEFRWVTIEEFARLTPNFPQDIELCRDALRLAKS